MKKRPIIIILSLFICIASTLSSCNYFSSIEEQTDISQNETAISTNERIKELEAQIIALLQSQQISESERKQEISVLKAELDSLKKKESENATINSTDETASKIFNYTLNGYKATITSINTDVENISIPSVIDGHAVTTIGSEALKSSKIKRIVLEDGIEALDWFAFKDCSSLSYIYIPKSVNSIGYGAFDGAPKSLTIECEKDSFAMKYAQSYGLKYQTK